MSDSDLFVSTGPVLLGPAARATLRPMTEARILGGFWSRRKRANREVGIPAGLRQLEQAGNLANLRLAAGRTTGAYRGKYPFQDSDVHKWLEAAAWEFGPSLETHAGHLVQLITQAQQPDGYLNSYYQVFKPQARFAELDFGHELYCAGHLIQAAVADARSSGGMALLAVACRLADHLDTVFGPDGREGIDGHSEIETALVELYRQTGTTRYLDLARILVDRRGHGLIGDRSFPASYYQDHEPVRTAKTVAGHAVRQLYLNAGVTDIAIETGDGELGQAMERQWEDMVATRTYLTGGVGAHHDDESFGDPYELPPERAYCETCAAIASIQWSWRLLLLTGRSRYGDLIERTLYNGFAGSVSLDGKRYFYVNPLQVRDDHPVTGRQPWFKCACCPPNIMRLLSTVDHYAATSDQSGLQLHQYATGSYGGGPAQVRVRTRYPWEGTVSVEVSHTSDDPWTLSLRMPHWCRRASIVVNGVPLDIEPVDGYLRVTRGWTAGDVVVVDFQLLVRTTVADSRVDAVRGCAALERGPIVYCLEAVDQPPGVRLDDVVLDVATKTQWQPDVLGGVVTVAAAGWVRERGDFSGWPYGVRSQLGERVSLLAVPYFAWGNRELGAMRVWIPVT
ncbi:glycoside hydrolase family 127 protein [Fodinicola feengrottensis]|uniref:Glycoside hydrolase family 127 protein n=1 Tax=Fodinicola feengrottensis TaxID=435914 RepID=A0ABN2HB48_9ACTN|nr:beta-L-arabinofuranosidase domain-containing protein [Fodinicola feengrottensis]